MMNRFHGVFSLVLVAVSLLIGIYVLMSESVLTGIVYSAVIAVSIVVIVYSYCSKCDCRLDSCGHVIPGKLTKFLPDRAGRGYNALDYIGVVLPFAAIILLPQMSLWKNKILFSLFWVFLVLALLEIFFFVCTKCMNNKCILCSRQQ
ncbi:hypothetical protein ACFL2O_00390 [Thermodesulfobacteriota bacterium]